MCGSNALIALWSLTLAAEIVLNAARRDRSPLVLRDNIVEDTKMRYSEDVSVSPESQAPI